MKGKRIFRNNTSCRKFKFKNMQIDYYGYGDFNRYNEIKLTKKLNNISLQI